jgi:predicted nucleic acid-binding protein
MPNEPVLVDTGALAALFDPNDQYHNLCNASAKELPVGKAFTCWPVITEAAYLLRRYPTQRDALLESLEAGEFQVLALHSSELPALREIFAKYGDQQIDLADAALLYLADREGLEDIFTVDRRHFSLFRKRNGKPLRLIPEA